MEGSILVLHLAELVVMVLVAGVVLTLVALAGGLVVQQVGAQTSKAVAAGEGFMVGGAGMTVAAVAALVLLTHQQESPSLDSLPLPEVPPKRVEPPERSYLCRASRHLQRQHPPGLARQPLPAHHHSPALLLRQERLRPLPQRRELPRPLPPRR